MVSIFFYASIMSTSVILAYYASQNKSKWSIIGIILLLSLLAGLRAKFVGLDTFNYNKLFDALKAGDESKIYGIEKSFRCIAKALLVIFKHNNWLFFIFSLLSNGLLIARLWDFREKSSFSIAVFCYYCVFYFASLNIMRQFFAATLIFYGSRFLSKGGYFRFLIFVLFATLFHRSALIGVGYLFCEFFMWKFLRDWQKIFLCCVALICVVIIFFALPVIEAYKHYFVNPKSDFGFMSFAKLGFLLITAILLNTKKWAIQEEENSMQDRYKLLTVELYYLIGILCSSIGYVYIFVDRIGLYFLFFECVYFGMIIKNLNFKIFKIKVFSLGALCLALYIFAIEMLGNGHGTVPYKFFWQ